MGKRCETSGIAASSVVASLGSPPLAATARRGALELGANRIVPSFPQLPPRPQAAQVHTTCEVLEATSSRRSSPAAK
jgi:hypothetical protein